jgi:hypothetical protein
VAAQQTGLNGRTDHIAEHHNASWHANWDRRRAYYQNNRWYAFNGDEWIGLDQGYYPWDYYPYYSYDYDPYNYYVGNWTNDLSGDPTDDAYNATPDATVENIQAQLAQQGYYRGPVDGVFGPATRDAVAQYQTSKGLTVTGSLSPDTMQSFGLTAQNPGS